MNKNNLESKRDNLFRNILGNDAFNKATEKFDWMNDYAYNKKYDLTFYKENETWYADVPNHTKEDNEMVMGSDSFLELFSKDGKHCKLTFYTKEPNDGFIMKFTRGEHDWDGAYYIGKGPCVDDMEIWICNVTHTVCGEHPETIYITNIE